MRTPTEDERTLFLSLKEEDRRLAFSTKSKGAELRVAFDNWLAGHGAGPTFDELHHWEQMQILREEVRAKLDLLVMDIFG